MPLVWTRISSGVYFGALPGFRFRFKIRRLASAWVAFSLASGPDDETFPIARFSHLTQTKRACEYPLERNFFADIYIKRRHIRIWNSFPQIPIDAHHLMQQHLPLCGIAYSLEELEKKLSAELAWRTCTRTDASGVENMYLILGDRSDEKWRLNDNFVYILFSSLRSAERLYFYLVASAVHDT